MSIPFTYVPPPGWDVLDTVEVTADNQGNFVEVLSCSLLEQHAKKVIGPDGGTEYVPPIGWWVVVTRRRDTHEIGYVWISPTGNVAIHANACTGAKVYGSDTRIRWIYWALAGLGIAFVLYPLFKKQE